MARNISGFDRQKVAHFIIDSLLFFVLAFVFYKKFSEFDINEAQLLWPVFWLTEEKRLLVVNIAIFSMFTAPFLTLFNKSRFPAQILCFLSAFILISISYSNGKSYHAGLSWIIFLPLFLSLKPFLGRVKAAHLAFFAFTTAYINSGIESNN